MNTPPKTIYRAAWACPVDQPPIENACVIVADDKITYVGSANAADANLAGATVVDLGDGAIIPGLVNAHTHLEFSNLDRPLGDSGLPFTDWVRLVVEYRNQFSDNPTTKQQAIQQGIAESFQAGVWAVGEIATQPFDEKSYSEICGQVPLHTTLFLEQLGRNPDHLERLRTELDDHLAAAGFSKNRCLAGASPHATYSVPWQLHDQIVAAATASNSPVAMHVAETESERQLLDSMTGEFVDLLKDFGAWDPESFRPQRSIKGFLGRLSQAPRSLIVHGNYLNDDELDLVARNQTMSIVYCPRTHDFFGHRQYPLKKILDRGINLAVGTDSRASSPDLNLYEDLKLVAAKFDRLSAGEVLQLGTLKAAIALGIDNRFGSLTPTKNAALSFVAKPPGTGAALGQWLFSNDSFARALV